MVSECRDPCSKTVRSLGKGFGMSELSVNGSAVCGSRERGQEEARTSNYVKRGPKGASFRACLNVCGTDVEFALSILMRD